MGRGVAKGAGEIPVALPYRSFRPKTSPTIVPIALPSLLRTLPARENGIHAILPPTRSRMSARLAGACVRLGAATPMQPLQSCLRPGTDRQIQFLLLQTHEHWEQNGGCRFQIATGTCFLIRPFPFTSANPAREEQPISRSFHADCQGVYRWHPHNRK